MEWLTTFGTFVGVAGVLGGVFAAFYASRSKGIIELLKTENTAYKESNERLHQDNDNLSQQLLAAKSELKVWRDNVTQRPSIEKMIETSQRQHKEYMSELAKVAKGLSQLVTQQGELTKVIAQTLIKDGSGG